jgi:hypothetical protein
MSKKIFQKYSQQICLSEADSLRVKHGREHTGNAQSINE